MFTLAPAGVSARPRKPPAPSAPLLSITSPAIGSTVRDGTLFSVAVANTTEGASIARVRYTLRYLGYVSFVDNHVGEATAATGFALTYVKPAAFYTGYGNAWVFVEAFDGSGRLVATAGDTTVGGVQTRHYVYVEGTSCTTGCALPRP